LTYRATRLSTTTSRDVEATLSLRHERPGEDGLYPGCPFESLTEMGARYLAFLTEPPARAMK
jgi:hypothetical protein